MKNILKIVFVIIGTLIGAGFASGKEIYIFFFSYGEKGILAIIISSILMGIIIYDVLKIIHKKEIKTYKEFLEEITSNSKNENIKYRKINKNIKSENVKIKDIKNKNKEITNRQIKSLINIIINLFMLISFYIMIAGFGAYCNQQFGIKPIIGSITLAILTCIIISKNIKGVVLLNQIIVPILIAFIILIGSLNILELDLINISEYITQTNYTNWLMSGVLYSSYNAILLIPVLITLRKYIKNEKQISKISIIIIAIVIILSLSIYGILIRVDVNIQNLEMPAAYVISNTYPYLKIPYAIILLSSILTTAVSLGNSFIEKKEKSEKKKRWIRKLICITAILVSGIGFSNLVNNMYPIFGYLGLIQILAIIIKAKKCVHF